MPFYRKTKPNKNGEQLIMLHFNYHRRRFKMSTGKSILPQDWDEKKNWPKRTFKYYPQYNALMLRLEEAVHNAYHELTVTHIPTIQELGQAVEDRLKPDNSQNLYQYALTFIRNRTEQGYEKESISIYTRTAEMVEKYDKHATFDRISWDWLAGFVSFLKKLHFEQNTINKFYDTLKTILNEATGTGVNKNVQYMTAKGVSRVETTQIYLNEDEIERFYKVECENKDQEEAKDIFVVMCFTGVRISDYDKISERSFTKSFDDEGNLMEYFSLVQHKVKMTVNIPVHPVVREIMEKYNWSLPKKSEQKIGKHIKNIGKLAGLTQIINKVTYPGGKMKTTPVAKYTQIKNHTARRSLACNMLIAGEPEWICMAVGGWKSQKSFAVYKRMTGEDKLKASVKSKFFKRAKVITLAS